MRMRKGMLGLLLAALLLASVSGAAWAADGPRVIGEEASSGSLEYAVNKARSSSSAVALVLKRIAGVYGEDSVRVQSALPGKNYSLVKPDDGVVMLETDGVKRLVFVEDAEGKKVLWAGAFSGGKQAPRAMLSWQPQEASDGGEKGLTLDLSEVQNACESPLLVQVAPDDSTYVVASDDDDSGLYHMDGEAANWFVLIGIGKENSRDYLWAGVIPGGDGQVTAVFQVRSEDFFDPGRILQSTPVPVAEPMAEPTAEPTPEPTPTPTPERKYTVTVEQSTAVYDGQPHEAQVTSEEAGVTYSYVLCRKNDWRPGENWEKGLPRRTDAGETWAFIRAEKAGAAASYVDENGKPMDWGKEYVKVRLSVEPAPVTLSLWAEQESGAVYTGAEQTLQMRFQAELAEDDGLFDLQALTRADGWVSEARVTGKDAGDYPIDPTDEQLAFIRSFDPNFDVTVRWKKSAARIEPLAVRLESASAAAVYDPVGQPLTADDPIKGVQDLATGDYFSGDLVAAGKQTQAGVGRNTIVLSGRFAERQHNYAFDLEADAGVLVVFPQSISKDDEAWDPEKADEMAAAYADTPDSELPGCYTGMQVELTEDTFDYDGAEKDVGVRFLNRQGTALKLTEGTDYTLGFFRDGEPTEDLSSPGVITVLIEGIGNYRGKVEQSVRITMSDKNASVDLDGWVYDGTAAGSAAHEPVVNGPDAEPEYTYYDESNKKVPAPSDAGTYTLTVSWPETDISPAMEAKCRFTISPAEATIYAGGGEKTYGDSDPVLKAAKVEGLLEGDSISCSIERAEGEDAGVYDTFPTVNEAQDDYLVTFVNGSFRIHPRPLDDGGVEVLWQGEEPELCWNGELLAPGRDYTVQVDEDGGVQRAVLTGKGNFIGQRTETREVAAEAALSLTDGDGAALPAEGLAVGLDGVLAVDGTVRLNIPVDSDRLAVQVNGQKTSPQWTGVDEVTYAFALRMDDPGGDELRVSVLLDGEEADAQSAQVRRGNRAVLWIVLTAALAVCSLACLVACLYLAKYLRREREKLLDETGRHSTRTIRMSNDEDG